MAMIARAMQAGVPFAWFTADEAYGQAKYLRAWLEERGVPHVVATRCDDTLITPTPLPPAGPGLDRRQQGTGGKRRTADSGPGMIGYTLPEIRRLLIGLACHHPPDPKLVLAWSNWR